jgi:CCR4-NOT transcription complex subunit 2
MDSVPTSTSSASSVTSSDGRSGAVGGGSEFLNLGMFGQSSGSGDLLLGTSGFGGGLGNGYGSDFGLGSSAKTSAFDLNDFPSLGGGAAGTVGPSAPSNGLAAALRQQQQLMAHHQMLQSGNSNSKSPNLYRLAMSSGAAPGANFNMATEDFPALPGAPPSGGGGNINGSGTEPGGPPLSPGGNTGFVTSMSRTSSAGASGSGLYGFELDGGSNQLEGAGLLGGLGGLAVLSSSSNSGLTLGHQRSSTPSSTSAGNVGSSTAPGPAGSSGGGSTLSGDYGLLGLLGVIRMTDADRNALALGSDLTLLGLNLNSNDQLYSTFASPWSENPATKEPHYQVRICI